MNPVYTHKPPFFKISYNIPSTPYANLPNSSIFSSVFSTKSLLLSIMHATHSAHHLIFGEAYKLWSSSSCSSLHLAVTSFPLRFEYSLTAFAGFVCDAAHGTAAMLGDVISEMLRTSKYWTAGQNVLYWQTWRISEVYYILWDELLFVIGM